LNNFFKDLFQEKIPYPFYIKNREDVVFIHITKNAGTSLTRCFDFNPVIETKNLLKHYTASNILEIIGQKKWEDAYKFTIVRNPWDRMLSYYFFRKTKQKKEFLTHDFTFEQLLIYLDDNKLLGDQKQLGRLQFDWLSIDGVNIDLNQILRFENLNEDIKLLAKNIDVVDYTFEKINASDRDSDYKFYYNKNTKSIIEKNYEKDIDYFKYVF
jgi:hypothetical protein